MALGLGQFLSDSGDMPTRPEIKGRSRYVQRLSGWRKVVRKSCEFRIFRWPPVTAFSPSLYLPSAILIRAGDKLLEATSETLATPKCFRGATMIQRQLRLRRGKRWKRKRKSRWRERGKKRIDYSDNARNLLVKTETSIPRLGRIKRARLLSGILDEVFHLVFRCVRASISSIHFLLSYWTIVSTGSELGRRKRRAVA